MRFRLGNLILSQFEKKMMLVLTQFIFVLQIRADNVTDLIATSGLLTTESTTTRELSTTETTTVTVAASSTSFSTTGRILDETGMFINPK